MKRAKQRRPASRQPQHRSGPTPRVLILSEDPLLGSGLRSEMRHKLRDLWFVVYETIMDFRTAEGDIIHDLVVYCPGSHELSEEVKEAIGKILFVCREAKIVLYTEARENPIDDRISAIVQRPRETELADVISKLLRPEAA